MGVCRLILQHGSWDMEVTERYLLCSPWMDGGHVREEQQMKRASFYGRWNVCWLKTSQITHRFNRWLNFWTWQLWLRKIYDIHKREPGKEKWNSKLWYYGQIGVKRLPVLWMHITRCLAEDTKSSWKLSYSEYSSKLHHFLLNIQQSRIPSTCGVFMCTQLYTLYLNTLVPFHHTRDVIFWRLAEQIFEINVLSFSWYKTMMAQFMYLSISILYSKTTKCLF